MEIEFVGHNFIGRSTKMWIAGKVYGRFIDHIVAEKTQPGCFSQTGVIFLKRLYFRSRRFLNFFNGCLPMEKAYNAGKKRLTHTPYFSDPPINISLLRVATAYRICFAQLSGAIP